MARIKILIVEDDPTYSIELERIVEELGHHLIGSTDNSEDAKRIVEENSIDLILMDINIKGAVNGIELANYFGEQRISIIFLTVFDDQQTYQSARETFPFGYLVKPVHKLNLQSMIDSLLIRQGESNISAEMFRLWQEDLILQDNIFIKSQNRLVRFNLNELYLIEAEGNYCLLYTKEKKYVVKSSLKRLKQKLSSKRFVQVHRNFVVQIPKIIDLDLAKSEVAILGRILPIGNSFRSGFIERLNKLD